MGCYGVLHEGGRFLYIYMCMYSVCRVCMCIHMGCTLCFDKIPHVDVYICMLSYEFDSKHECMSVFIYIFVMNKNIQVRLLNFHDLCIC